MRMDSLKDTNTFLNTSINTHMKKELTNINGSMFYLPNGTNTNKNGLVLIINYTTKQKSYIKL